VSRVEPDKDSPDWRLVNLKFWYGAISATLIFVSGRLYWTFTPNYSSQYKRLVCWQISGVQ